MSLFPDWYRYVVRQEEMQTGCIPTGYEILLRSAKVEGIDFTTFQRDFDLDLGKDGTTPKCNTFESVASAILAKYSQICFKMKSFAKGEGKEKFNFIVDHLKAQIPVLVSATNLPQENTCHIMPAVDANDAGLIFFLYWDGNFDHVPLREQIDEQTFIQLHELFPGGDDVAFIDV
jgi:hypothetical protein